MKYNGGNGNIFFDCDWEAENNSSAGPCGGMAHFWELVTYWYKLTDERGFYDAVEKDLGFEREWIRLGHTHDTTCDSSVCLNATGTSTGSCKGRMNDSKISIPYPTAQI